jgi:hypothetical protein
MARTGPGPDPGLPGGRHPDLLDAKQFAALLGIPRVQTLTDLAAAGEVPGAARPEQAGRNTPGTWLFNLRVFYPWLAGPGVPFGEIVDSAELADLLGLHERAVRRARRDPGSGEGLPGRHVGRKVLFAVPAVWQQLGWPLDSLPAPHRALAGRGPGHEPGARAGSRRGSRDRTPAALDVADVGAPQPGVTGQRAAAGTRGTRRSGPRPGRQGRRAAPR